MREAKKLLGAREAERSGISVVEHPSAADIPSVAAQVVKPMGNNAHERRVEDIPPAMAKPPLLHSPAARRKGIGKPPAGSAGARLR